MNNNMKLIVATLVGILLGVIITYTGRAFLFNDSEKDVQSEAKKPLYWVAPMDSSYRRDKPGNSPMGMALVPVYAKDGADSIANGSVKISPQVINNLGVRTTKVKRQALQSQIQTIGVVEYDQDKLLHIHPRVEGWIEKLYVKAAGDSVKANQALYDIYSPDLVNAQQEYLLALERQRGRLIKASENRLRALQLPSSLINKLKKTRKVQQRVTFYAPQDGIIDNLNIREGFFVKPGTTMMSIADLSEVWVQAEIFERQASWVQLGDKVSMTLGYLPDRQWFGQVDYIYPTLDANTRTVKLRLRFSNKKALLKPNMFAQIRVNSIAPSSSLSIPKEAVIRTGQQDRVVLALGDGQFKSIAVKLGREDSQHFEILQGLKEGDNIVVSAQFLIDSESSKNSDFMRIDPNESSNKDHSSGMKMTEATKPPIKQSARVNGFINSINIDKPSINISREAIEKWGRPAATLDFVLDKDIDLADFTVGSKINFTFEIREQDFVITALHQEDHK